MIDGLKYDWGWERYERTMWTRDDPDGKRKMYIGHFLNSEAPLGWMTCNIRFWAKRPIKAMSAIVQSGRNPAVFADQTVN